MDFLKKKPVTDSLIAISIENTLSNFSGIGYHFIALLFSLVWIRIFNVFDHLRDTNKIISTAIMLEITKSSPILGQIRIHVLEDQVTIS